MDLRSLFAPFLIGSTLLASTAHASFDLAGAKLRGFMTLGADYSSFDGQNNSLSKGLSFSRDTRLGLNVTANFSDDWSFAGQLLARKGAGNYQVTADWLFATWRPTDQVSVRAGRQIFAAWLYSDQIDVGYNYIWVIPPQEVYALLPLKSYNGLSAAYSLNVGNGLNLTGELFGGVADVYVNGTTGISVTGAAKNLRGADISLQSDFFQIRSMIAQADVSLSAVSQQLLPFGSISAGTFPSAYAGVPVNFDTGVGTFFSLGGRMDWHNVIVISEFARRLVQGSSLTRQDGIYGTVGYRFWRLIPNFTYAWTGNAEGTQSITPRRSLTFGMNYNVNDSAVIKLNYQLNTNLETPNTLTAVDYSMPQNQTESTITATLDLVF